MFNRLSIILFIISVSVNFASSAIEGNIGLMGLWPKNEFKNQGVPIGLGLDFNGIIYPLKELGFGINFGLSQYGNSTRSVSYYFSDLVAIEEETKNNIFSGHLFFKFTPCNKKWNVQPYVEGLVGFKNFYTETTLYNENGHDDPETTTDEREISASTNASDTAFSYGGGVGLDVLLKKTFNKNTDKITGALFFFINGRYLLGAEAQYLKEDDIEYSDPSEGPVTTTFNWNQSTTDLLNISLGLSLRF